MPEGPEVECTRRSLKKFESKKIASIRLTELSQKYEKYRGKQSFFDEFVSKTLLEIERIGKFLIWKFDFPKVILNHLGMTGHWIIIDEKKPLKTISHPKIEIIFENKRETILFSDTRNFGQFKIYDTYQNVLAYTPIRKMGFDGLKKPFPQEEFNMKLKLKKYENKEIGEVLLDQSLISGIGNIYKSESLAQAKISPFRKVKNLNSEEIERLGSTISIILHKAVENMGSTIQSYRTSSGEPGSAQNWHKVYSKEGKKCDNCGNTILRSIQNKRSTFYCEKCQR